MVGGVEITGAVGGGGGGSENGLGGVKEAEAAAGVIEESGCSTDIVKNVLGVDGATSSWCKGSPTCSPGRGKLAVLRPPMSSSLDGGDVPISSPSRSIRSRSDSVSFNSSTLVVAGHGLDGGGVGAELLRFSEGIWDGEVAMADVGMGNGGTLDCPVGGGSQAVSSDPERLCWCRSSSRGNRSEKNGRGTSVRGVSNEACRLEYDCWRTTSGLRGGSVAAVV